MSRLKNMIAGFLSIGLSACSRSPFSLSHERRIIEGPLDIFSHRVTPYASLGGNGEYLLVGTKGGHIELRSASHGGVIWRKGFDSAVTTQATICKNHVFVGFSNASFLSLDLKTGQTLWKYEAPSSLVGKISCSENKVFVGTNQGHFYALGIDKGDMLWSLRQDAGDHMTVQSFALIDSTKQTHIVAFSNGVVMAVDLEGNTLWTSGVDVPGAKDFKDISAITRLDPETLFVAQYEGHASALRDSDGKSVWSLENGGSLAKSSVDGDKLFVPMSNQQVAMLEAKTGTVLWKWEGPQGPGWTGLGLYKNYVLASSGDGHLHVLNKVTGHFVWSYDFGTPLLGDVIVTKSGFWALSQKGQLMKFSE